MSQRRESDTWIASGVTVDGSTSQTKTLKARGSDTISGVVTRSSAFNVKIEWLDTSDNTVNTQTVVSASSGTQTFSEDAHGDFAKVIVEDDGTADSATADINAKLR